jgi:hypothetical protein
MPGFHSNLDKKLGAVTGLVAARRGWVARGMSV